MHLSCGCIFNITTANLLLSVRR